MSRRLFEEGVGDVVAVVRLPVPARLLGGELQALSGHLRADAGNPLFDGGGPEEPLLGFRVVPDEGNSFTVAAWQREV